MLLFFLAETVLPFFLAETVLPFFLAETMLPFFLQAPALRDYVMSFQGQWPTALEEGENASFISLVPCLAERQQRYDLSIRKARKFSTFSQSRMNLLFA